MMILGLVWPTCALVALTFAVWLTLFVQRSAHMRRNPPQRGDMATGEAALRYFQPVEMPANNLANLFEMPVMFFALVPLLMLTAQVSAAQVVLAWVFVAARVAHSVIHIATKKVPLRFLAYLASCAVLLAMWIGFFVDALVAAHGYHAALAQLPQP
jgi:hypothetical protein